jgi:hypothetical protein
VTHEKEDRESLIRKARCGEISSHAAEAEAKRLGLEPLARKPKESDFDPMSEPRWSLAMAMAWIVWRRPRLVLAFWDKYRLECWDWHSHHVETYARRVYHLVQRRPATLGMLESDSEVRAEETFVKNQMSRETAKAALWRALQEGTLQATGINFDTGRRVLIPDLEWHDLEYFEEDGRDVFRAHNIAARSVKRTLNRGTADKLIAQLLQGRGDVDACSQPPAYGYANVLFNRTEAITIWPPLEHGSTSGTRGRLDAKGKKGDDASKYFLLPKDEPTQRETLRAYRALRRKFPTGRIPNISMQELADSLKEKGQPGVSRDAVRRALRLRK